MVNCFRNGFMAFCLLSAARTVELNQERCSGVVSASPLFYGFGLQGLASELYGQRSVRQGLKTLLI